MLADILIIGAGPAGMAAALQLKRTGFKPLLVEKNRIGGALLNAGWVENYPGFPDGITGKELVELFEHHICKIGIKVHHINIEYLQRKGNYLYAKTSSGNIKSKYAVIAAGCVPVHIGIPGEEDNSGKTVFYELRDVPITVGEKACVIGGGDAAFDYALSLADRRIQVNLLMRSNKPRCLKLLADRVKKCRQIRVIPGVEPLSFQKTEGGILLDLHGDTAKEMQTDFVIIAVGRQPNLSFLSPDLSKISKWNCSPLFFAGDVINGDLRQVGIAVGDGIKCAMEIARMLNFRGK